MNRVWVRFVLILLLALPAVGCSGGNDKEFLDAASPGKPPENPDEGYAARRERVNATPPAEPPAQP